MDAISELSDDDMFADSDDESDPEGDDSMDIDALSPAEKQKRMEKLVPPLPASEWGSNASSTTIPSTETKASPADMDVDMDNDGEEDVIEIDRSDEQVAGSRKGVSFAADTKPPAHSAGDSPYKLRPPAFEPIDYDGHVIESDDSDNDGEASNPSKPKGKGKGSTNPMGWTAERIKNKESGKKRTSTGAGGGAGKSRKLDSRIHAMQESLRTGKPVAEEGLRDYTLGDSYNLSDSEDGDGDGDEDEDEDMAGSSSDEAAVKKGESSGSKQKATGGMEVDMMNEEEEFLRFARDTLGINEEMWEGMISDRKAKGGEHRVIQSLYLRLHC